MKYSQVTKSCANCGISYSVKKSRADKSRYCCNPCKRSGSSLAQRGRAMPTGCIKEKYGNYTRLQLASKCGHLTKKGRTYCAKCRENLMGKVSILCAICSTAFLTHKSSALKYKCCSMECRNKSIAIRQAGEKSHLWKGGITSDAMRIRNSAEYAAWRKTVMDRDDYTCNICGVRGGKLCVDHIKSFSLYPALRFDTENGRTLCYSCHQKTDNFGHKAVIESKKYTNRLGETQLCLI